MKLSLILATYGRAAEIERLFDSLAQQSCRDRNAGCAAAYDEDLVLVHVMESLSLRRFAWPWPRRRSRRGCR